MTKDELHNHIKSVAEDYISKSWNTFLDLDEIDLVMAGIGVGKIIAGEQDKRIEELEKENAELKDKLEMGIALKDEEIGCIQTDFNTFKSKAKEIIKRLLSYEKTPRDCLTERYRKLLEEAEQFLSEMEK